MDKLQQSLFKEKKFGRILFFSVCESEFYYPDEADKENVNEEILPSYTINNMQSLIYRIELRVEKKKAYWQVLYWPRVVHIGKKLLP